ncbi:hypothetical protein BS78_05G217000 [Paspalum vaginatum]|nr:hypothetical protein BS78_05G217000 [Paspalum vaginatum]
MSSSEASAVGSGHGHGDGEVLTASAIVAEAVTGSHVLEIKGYSLSKGLGNGKFVRSSTFSVGGHRWCIRYFPDCQTSDCADWISVFLVLDHAADDSVDVKAQFQFSVLDNINEPVPRFRQRSLMASSFSAKNRSWGYIKFAERKTLEESVYVKDDCLRIKCDITVTKNIRTEAATHQFVVVPPSEMHQHFGRLLSTAEGTTDITFEVAGEMFPAHRCVLASRSSVFMADLFGSMKKKAKDHRRIDDMEARVFKAMVHFIYTDAMPEMDKEEDAFVITQHLLVAADRYDLERLSLKLLQSPCLLKTAMPTEGFDHFISSCPSLIKELMLVKVGACP